MTNTSFPTRHVRTTLPAEVHDRLRHLGLDLGRALADLLAEGAVLVLEHHGRGEGPVTPTNRKQEVDR